jgi:penicillin-binding protein 1C
VTVGVWVGNFDRTPLRGSSGITGAGPIFNAVMLAAVEHQHGALPLDDHTPVIDPPAELERRDICALSGMTPGAACPTRASEWVPRGHAQDTCTWHHASDRGLVTVWPELYRDWARREGLAGALSSAAADMSGIPADITAAAAPERQAAPVAHAGNTPLTITRPLAGGVFMIDPTLRPEFQMLSFSARGGEGRLFWFVDGEPFATGAPGESVRWPLSRGRHEILVRDNKGQTAQTRIEVR